MMKHEFKLSKFPDLEIIKCYQTGRVNELRSPICSTRYESIKGNSALVSSTCPIASTIKCKRKKKMRFKISAIFPNY